MERPIEEYIRATYSFLRLLKESERSRTTLAAREDGKLVVVREIEATGLPYAELKELSHPLFARIFLTAEENGRTWVVEEYIDGESLQELWERGERFSATEIKAMLREMTQGLAVLHHAGIVHRDACTSSTSTPRASCAKARRLTRAISVPSATRRPSSMATARPMQGAIYMRSV